MRNGGGQYMVESPLALGSNYAFKPIAEQALRSNENVVPQRLNAALDIRSSGGSGESVSGVV